MTNHDFRALIAVKAARQTAANNWWKNHIDTAGGENTFTVGLSASGNAPATWYWCNTKLTKTQLIAVKTIMDANPGDARLVIWPTDNGHINDLLEQFMDNGTTIRVLPNASITPAQLLATTGLTVISPAI